jgi:hypothetical protein
MIEDPGSFSGNESSPSPHLGPDPRNLMSLAIFINEVASVFKDPLTWIRASFEASSSNLLSPLLNSYPVYSVKFSATFSENPM